MPSAKFAPALAFAAAAFALISCADSGPAADRGSQRAASAWYVEQIEEGFGHLDQLPRNWSALPSRHQTAWFVGRAAD
jgi:hypothetical protein